MEEMLARWLRETRYEFEKARKYQNLYKMSEMHRLEAALHTMKDKLLKPKEN